MSYTKFLVFFRRFATFLPLKSGGPEVGEVTLITLLRSIIQLKRTDRGLATRRRPQ